MKNKCSKCKKIKPDVKHYLRTTENRQQHIVKLCKACMLQEYKEKKAFIKASNNPDNLLLDDIPDDIL